MKNANCVERIYIMDGGLAKVDDGSIYSPGVNVGVPMTLSCNAYLIRHPEGWLLWDTGTSDDMVKEPEGRVVAHGINGVVRTTMAAQLESIGVAPDDIDRLVLSHAHYDHVGNCRLFPKRDGLPRGSNATPCSARTRKNLGMSENSMKCWAVIRQKSSRVTTMFSAMAPCASSSRRGTR
jgi:glyoxylase-like metal-dependent hydrolase (beta-lactamase superfamily II)